MSGEERARQVESAGAIRDVLAAEAEVRRKVETCREDIAQALAAEQERARAIEERTSQRLSRLHAHCEHRIDERTRQLRARAGAQAPPAQLDASDQARVQSAVESLAARLSGADDG